MTTEQNSVLVEYDGTELVRVVRTYLSARRAEEDRELLALVNPDRNFRVTTVEFIDN